MKVCFAIPTITGDIRCETAIAITEAIILCRELGIETDFLVLANCPVISVARNTLEAMFMADPEATDMFFIDYDVRFNAEAVLQVLRRPEEIVAGAYRVKVDDKTTWAVEIQQENGVPKGKIDGDEVLLKADFLATGFMRIKRSALDRMRAAYPDLCYEENVIKTENRRITEAYDLFGMGIDKERRRYTTEDFYFCKRWREIGGELWCYPNVDFDHIGKKAYSGNYHEYLLTLPGSRIAKANEVPGWMSVRELHWLATQSAKYKNIVEVGCWMGRSTTALASGTTGTVYAVDTWEGSPEHGEIMQSITPDNLYKAFQHHTSDIPNIVAIRQPSIHAASKQNWADRVDMVFLDGSHDYQSVIDDIRAWLPKIKDGGLLCGHDYNYCPGVKRAVDEILPEAKVIPDTDIWAVTIDSERDREARRDGTQSEQLAERNSVAVGAD
jgi:predicted O-methyltransferase YrrM